MTKKYLWIAVPFLLLLTVIFSVTNRKEGDRDIFLITADPTPIHLSRSPSPVVIYKVEAGSLRPVQEFNEINMYVRPHPYRGLVLIHSGLTLNDSETVYHFHVVRYDNASQAEELLVRTCAECDSHRFSYFMQINDKEYHIVVTTGTERPEGSSTRYERFVYAVELDTGEQSSLEYNDLKHALSFGSGGLAYGSDYVEQLFTQGHEIIRYWGDDTYHVDFSLPEKYAPAEQRQLIQAVNNEHVKAFSWYVLGSPTPVPSEVMVFNKSTGTWHDFAVPGNALSLRGFGPWLAGEMRYARNLLQTDNLPAVGNSPTVGSTSAKATEDFSAEGTLYLYDTRNQQLITYSTSSAGNQILYVEDGVVYFRVEDELRKGRIRRGELGEVELVAKAEHISKVHWMFLGHE